MNDRIEREVIAIVVTHNRLDLLKRCINSLLNQSYRIDHILIIDNASIDGTEQAFATPPDSRVHYARLPSNTGGAGGFAAGIERALRFRSAWFWMMDDDACPHLDALEKLLKIADNPSNIYGSLAICGENTSWTTTLLDLDKATDFASEVPTKARVKLMPFLGFLIHRELVNKIGVPDAGLFIAADDVEYCLRARLVGADVYVAGSSRIEHPRVRQGFINLMGIRIAYLSLPPWKRYYDIRNRLLIARKYYGIKLLTNALPGTLARLLAAVLREPKKLPQLLAFFAGTVDGLLGVKGKRHTKWRIPE